MRALLIAAASALAVIGLRAAGTFDALERYTLDTRQRLLARPESPRPEAVLVVIDQHCLDERKAEMTWPWPRESWAYLVDFCRAAGARAVVFDFFFSEPDPYPENDRAFARALRDYGHGYLAAAFANEPGKTAAPSPPFALRGDAVRKLHEYQGVTLPTAELLDAAAGIVDAHAEFDSDGILRRYALVSRIGETPVASAALAAYLERTPSAVVTIETADGFVPAPVRASAPGIMQLRYENPAPPFPRYCASEVMQAGFEVRDGQTPRIALEDFRGRVVFVGATAPGLMDLRSTPVDPSAPGVHVHLTAFANLLDASAILRVGWVPLQIAAACLLAAAALVKLRALFAWLSIVALAAAVVVVSIVLLRSNRWLEVTSPLAGVVVASLAALTVNYLVEGRQKARIRATFSRYVAPGVVDKILLNPGRVSLEGERKKITLLFMDFEGFTSLSEKMDSREVVRVLNEYHTAAMEEIYAQEGTIDKFIGDAVMAFWGDPVDQPDQAIRACRAALEIQRRVRALTEKRGLRARIGLNTGLAIVGNMGSTRHMNYTAIGDEVNLASRLEGANKEFGTSILVGESTWTEARERFVAREVALLRVKGKANAVRVFELLGTPDFVSEERAAAARAFEAGLAAFRARRLDEAARLWNRPDLEGDRVTALYRAMLASPPPDDVVELHGK